MQARAKPHGPLRGAVKVPGDKSISHRSLIFAALAVGRSTIEGLLESEDVLATAAALKRMGIGVERDGNGAWTVLGAGIGGLGEPDDVLDMGNAGTAARLMAGLVAGYPFITFMTGDASLRSRPMGRVTVPLSQMGATFAARSGMRLPMAITGTGELVPISYESPVASAQVKSAVLIAGLHAKGRTSVTEPLASRDHTERMLSSMGANVAAVDNADGSRTVSIDGLPELEPQAFLVPGDPSSAAFPIAAAAGRPGSEVTVTGVSVNPLRTGLIATLREMGADLTFANEREVAGEPVADIVVRGTELDGVDVPAARAPAMIDEYPVLAVLASFAKGTTRMRGLAELRVKESDRLTLMADGLAAAGVAVEVEGDDLIVHGGAVTKELVVDARLDHRIAMSFLVLGGLGAAPVTVSGAEAIATSFPDFTDLMNGLGASIAPVADHG